MAELPARVVVSSELVEAISGAVASEGGGVDDMTQAFWAAFTGLADAHPAALAGGPAVDTTTLAAAQLHELTPTAGVCCLEHGQLPWAQRNRARLFDQIRRGEYALPTVAPTRDLYTSSHAWTLGGTRFRRRDRWCTPRSEWAEPLAVTEHGHGGARGWV